VKLYDGVGIVDRPGHQGDYWTYNQGVYLGGLEALHAATGEIKYLEEAALVVKSMIEKSGIVTSEKILLEKLSTEGWDVGMFKGICARYWGLLAYSLRRAKIRTDVAAQIEEVLRASCKAVLTLPQQQGLYPLEWQSHSRAEVVNFNTHASAILLLMAETLHT
jgi:predicted alpha-1,6-mannanase (GH76 family)